MYLKEKLEEYKDKRISIYIDMDGVIVDYEVGKAFGYDKKRPLFSSIDKLKEISKMENVTMHILSISKTNKGVEEKNIWLDKYIPFIENGNRNIISKEKNPNKASWKLKFEFLNKLNDDVIILIDDDPSILHKIRNKNENIILFKDTVLID